MTPQGAVIVAVFLIIAVLAFLYDKKKADKIRAEVDQKYDGKHVCDFKDMYYSGYIAEDMLVLKERVRGYLQIDLKKVKSISYSRVRLNGVSLATMYFYDENGRAVGDSSKMKQMSPRAAEKLMNLVTEHASWIVRDSYYFPQNK
ncbi:MAG: hypothetical protein NC412_11155 [Roseburia sp.]|nr:hypothetical protein [Roseburia sp.]MCM1278877.1 hypothetical protein [Robinsoniella sp.]